MSATKSRAVDARNDLLAALAAWAATGGLRWLDVAFARFVADHCPGADAATLFAAAWVARAEGSGHSCIAIDAFDDEFAAAIDDGTGAHDDLRAWRKALPRTTAAWLRALKASGAVHSADELLDQGMPLVLDGTATHPLLYLRRYWQYERDVATRVGERVSDELATDAGRLRTELASLFPEADREAGATDWQKVACAIAMRGRFAIVTGGPGTGKTYVAARILAATFATAADVGVLRVGLAAPTGKAAARLRQSIDQAFATLAPGLAPATVEAAARVGAATTLHALLGSRFGSRRLARSPANPLDLDLLIVDEASMINVEMMASLLAALPSHARLVLLGDKDQLASVEAGAVLGDLCRDAGLGRYDRGTTRLVAEVAGESLDARCLDPTGLRLAQQVTMLRTSRRFDRTIAALADAVNAGDAPRASALLRRPAPSVLRWMVVAGPDAIVDRAFAVDAPGFGEYVDLVRAGPALTGADGYRSWVLSVLRTFDRFRVLSALRDGAWGAAGINRAIEERLAASGLFAAGRSWYVGRPVMVTRNDYGLGLFNGDVGICLPGGADDEALRVHFTDGATVRSIGVARLAEVETAFALTVHKAQGSEFDHTLLVLPPDAGRVATRELLYTGITRARTGFTLVTADDASLETAVERRTVRASGLAGRLR